MTGAEGDASMEASTGAAAVAEIPAVPSSEEAKTTTDGAEDDNFPASPMADNSDDPNVWYEALGMTAKGTCVRHTNCPVWIAHTNTVMSCRVCFSEEKSAGIRQRQTFTAVVQQLQKSSSSQRSLTAENEGAAFPAATILQQPQSLESLLKRLAQVQNWMLRRKEKEVHSLQMQIHKLEQRLADSEQTSQEQKQTIRALRRTIQQDLKLIKTMATQKQMELEAEAEYEALYGAQEEEQQEEEEQVAESPAKAGATSITSSDDDETPNVSPTKRSPTKAGPVYRSPPKRNVSPFPVNRTPGSEGPSPQKDPRMQGQMAFFQRASRARGEQGGARRMRSFDESIPEEDDAGGQNGDIVVERANPSSYWNDADMTLAANPSKLFASFRGGLLDIPKSPPPPTHDNRRERKLQIGDKDMSALQLPVRGVLSRHNSADPTDYPLMSEPPPLRKGRKKTKAKIGISSLGIGMDNEKKEIPIDLLAQSLTALPLSRKLDHQSPEQFFSEKLTQNASLPVPPLAAEKSLAHHLEKSNAKQPKRPSIPSAIPKITASPQKNATMVSDPVQLTNAQPPVRAPSLAVALQRHVTAPASISVCSGDTGPTFAENASVVLMYGHDPSTQQPKKNHQADDHLLESPASDAEGEEDTFATNVSRPSFREDSLVGGTSRASERFIFTVTGARCNDKYGDSGEYTGTILVTEGLPHGTGTMNYESGRVYSGEWVAGQWNGKGKLLNPNGDTYEGEFVFDARHGKGVYKWDNGDVYTGMFRDDKRHGKGKFCFHNGNVYEGEFCDGMFDGYGKYKFDGGYYEGEWKEGKYHGNGELLYATGGKYTGEFRNSVAHGFGMEVSPDGTKRRGVWEHGQPVE